VKENCPGPNSFAVAAVVTGTAAAAVVVVESS